jgi:hypothetical protein
MWRRLPRPRIGYPPRPCGGNPATRNGVVRGCGNGHRSARQRRGRDAWQRFVFEDNNAQLVIDALTGSCVFRRSSRRRQCCAILWRCWTANWACRYGRIAYDAAPSRHLAHPGASRVRGGRGASAAGWIGVLSDQRIGGALTPMHGDVGHRWIVGDRYISLGVSFSL